MLYALNPHSRRGQSIAEVLIAVTIGAILVGVAASLILPALKTNKQATNIQQGAALGKGLLDNVRVWSEGNWSSLLSLSTGSANTYFLQTGQTPFSAVTGTEGISNDNINSGLVGWWKFDEGIGTNASDSSGNGRNCSGISGWGAGKVGGASVSFPGGFSCTTPSVITGGITFTAWINPTTSTGDIVGFGGYNPTWGYSFGLSASSTFFNFQDAGANWYDKTSSPFSFVNQWHFVAVTHDGVNTVFYIDGQSPQIVPNPHLAGAASNTLSMGSVGWSAFHGLVDDVRLYNRALSASEVSQIYGALYTRYFYVSDAYRNASGTIVTTPGVYDPSTKKITVGYSWPGATATQTISTYLTRNRSSVVDQTDWFGGSGLSVPETSTNNQFATSSNISYASTTGSITIAGIVGTSSAVYANGYTYRKTITITGASVSGTLTNFPLLISGTYSYLKATSSGGFLQNPNGYDLIFTSDATGTSPLAYERESYASSSGAVNYWVKMPTLSSSSNILYMFYGSSSVATDQSSASATWNANYTLIQHLPNGSSLSLNDSTGNVSPTNNGVTATTGQIDGAGAFNGSSQYIDDPMTINYGAITVEAWFNSTNLAAGGNNPRVVANSHTDVDFKGFQLMFNSGGGSGFFDVGNGSTDIAGHWTQALSNSTWYHYVGTYDGTSARAYINGVLAANSTSTSGSITASGMDVNIGRNPVYTGDYFPGTIDEVRISNTARSSQWILTEYNNQSNPSSFYTIL